MFEMNSNFSGLGNFAEEIQKSLSGLMPNVNELQNGNFSSLLKDKKIPGLDNINLEIIQDTFNLQDKFNESVVPGWKLKKLDWWMAITDEINEILNSVNWKWWKGTKNLNEVGKKVDMKNVEVEMIDIFHFLISLGIEQQKQPVMLMFLIAGTKFDKKYEPLEIIRKTRYEMRIFADLEIFEMTFYKWVELWFGMGKSLDYLMKAYRIKNALNIIRQKFGYKQGTYEKIWDREKGLEDNVIAWQIAEKLELNKEFFSKLIEELTKYYLNNVKPF